MASSSSNPFRRRATHQKENRFPPIDPIDTSQTLTLPPKTSFRDDEPPTTAAARGHDKKPKVVKKVRVLSPPPRSPDSPQWPAVAPADAPPRGELAQDPFDPFDASNAAASDDSDWEPATTPPPPHPALPQAHALQGPANPFGKKLQKEDAREAMREEGQVLKAANNTARRSLNVDSFRRLLLTGATSPPSSPPSTEESSDREPESTSSAAIAIQTGREKKAPPPPPSSRHGKSLRLEPGDTALETVAGPHEDLSSPAFAELENELHSKKPVPAPPPRRGHARAESKGYAILSTTRAARSASTPSSSEPPSRSSMDSTPSQSGSIRQGAGPPAPPPPPRRPHAAPPPPPPPARHASTRRALSAHNIEGISQRTSVEGKPRDSMAPPPPPPPSRLRGSSQSSMDGPPRRTSTDLPSGEPAPNLGKSVDLLADLDALQREVDALRGKF